MEGFHGSISYVGCQTVVQSGQSNVLRCRNWVDKDGNPSSGYAHGIGFSVTFQDGPRGKDDQGQLQPANGAFVEDLLTAAMQRLAFFQNSRFNCSENAEAIEHINKALQALNRRASGRAQRGVLGSNQT
jgi:hypothetical protein